MSHTTKIGNVAIKDIATLRNAVANLKRSGVNCDLVENQQPRMYFSNQSPVLPYVLKLHESQYDVGFELKDGVYVPVFDEYQNHVGRVLAPKCGCAPASAEDKSKFQIGTLLQEYAKETAIAAASMQGYFVESCDVDEVGNVHLTLGGI